MTAQANGNAATGAATVSPCSAQKMALDLAIKALKLSPTFAMSLGARELFHTNFLAFIIESEDPSLAALQIALRDVLQCNYVVKTDLPNCLVWREKNHLDLIIVPLLKGPLSLPDTSRAVVVEAKLKSIPTPQQLIAYSARLAGNGIELELPDAFSCPCAPAKKIYIASGKAPPKLKACVLLSPADVTPCDLNWTHVDWKKIADAFNASLPPSAALSPSMPPKLASILQDYAETLENLLAILDWVDCETKVFLPPSSSGKLGALLSQMKDQSLVKIRLHDLAGKYCFSIIESSIRNNIFPWPPALPKLCPQSPPAGWLLSTYTSYSNMSPTVAFEWKWVSPKEGKKKERSVSIGVQIQGNRYRHFVSVSHDQLQKPSLENVCTDKIVWEAFLNPLPVGCNCARGSVSVPHGFEGTAIRKVSTLVILNPISKNGRLTNLKKFTLNRFLFSDIDCEGWTAQQLEQNIATSLCLASKVVSSKALDTLQ